ncbi:MAG: putative porin [Fibrobacteria bacterium]|nr:putative porin [Fibrobacteria bacterium]
MKILFIIAAILFTGAIAEEVKESIKLGGSFRYRHEMFIIDGKDNRNRQRVAAKASLKAKVVPSVSVKFELASGGATARSANATLDNAFTKKDLFINQANFHWAPEFGQGLSLTGGKMKNPFAKVGKSELVYDSDFVPEGIALQYAKDYGSLSAFMNAAGIWVEEESSSDDVMLYAGQLGVSLPFADKKAAFTIGTGYYFHDGLKGTGPYEEGKSFGNSADTAKALLEDYTPWEVFAELGMKISGVPASLFGHYVQNFAADDDNVGFLAGVTLGKVKKPGSLGFRAYYRYMQKDAVFALTSDSDFGGGTTDNQGVELNADVGIANNIKGSVTYFINSAGLDNGTSYQRGQFDVKFTF